MSRYNDEEDELERISRNRSESLVVRNNYHVEGEPDAQDGTQDQVAIHLDHMSQKLLSSEEDAGLQRLQKREEEQEQARPLSRASGRKGMVLGTNNEDDKNNHDNADNNKNSDVIADDSANVISDDDDITDKKDNDNVIADDNDSLDDIADDKNNASDNDNDSGNDISYEKNNVIADNNVDVIEIEDDDDDIPDFEDFPAINPIKEEIFETTDFDTNEIIENIHPTLQEDGGKTVKSCGGKGQLISE